MSTKELSEQEINEFKEKDPCPAEDWVEKIIEQLDQEFNACSIFSKEELVDCIKENNGNIKKIQEKLFG